MMDLIRAKAKIRAIFRKYMIGIKLPKGASPAVRGAVYEMYALTIVINYLNSAGYIVRFSNPFGAARFKSKPGLLRQSDPHFVAHHPRTYSLFEVYVDVEVKTFGCHGAASLVKNDTSWYHEIDVGVFEYGINNDRPRYDQVALAVECKAVKSITKDIVRAVLGLRRELGVLRNDGPSTIASAANLLKPTVPCFPASEVWLLSTDKKVLNYRSSPASFGIQCRHEEP